MTRKNAKKTAARARQAKTGQSYQSALRGLPILKPDNIIQDNREGLIRMFEQAFDACADQLDHVKSTGLRQAFEGAPTFSATIDFLFPSGQHIVSHPVHDLKNPVPENLQPHATFNKEVSLEEQLAKIQRDNPITDKQRDEIVAKVINGDNNPWRIFQVEPGDTVATWNEKAPHTKVQDSPLIRKFKDAFPKNIRTGSSIIRTRNYTPGPAKVHVKFCLEDGSCWGQEHDLIINMAEIDKGRYGTIQLAFALLVGQCKANDKKPNPNDIRYCSFTIRD